MIKTLCSLLLLSFTVIELQAQDQVVLPCRHNDLDLLRPLHQDDPVLLQRMVDDEAELEAFTATFVHQRGGGGDDAQYLVPVVFHIIHDNGPENISDAQIHDAMRVLNDDFRRLNADWSNVNPAFLDAVADVGIEFRLAKKDPAGNCTSGITRTVSPLTHQGEQAMKQLIQWPRNRYMNVWVSASAAGAAGYTYRPGSVAQWPAGDGIVMQHAYTGSIGTSSPHRSRTLTHEVGHWLNLLHTWGNGNTPAQQENCDMDDLVADTPNTIGWTGCSTNGSTCGSLDNVQNFMEYAYCSRMFTQGQAQRMIAALNSPTAQRTQLWQSSNLSATGVYGSEQLCEARFTADAGVICAGTTVTYEDVSYHGVESRNWSFPGGTPSFSSLANPVITYDEPGIFPVTLTVSDGSSVLTVVKEDHVRVLAVPGDQAPFHEGFETLEQLDGGPWMVRDPDGGNTFQLNSNAAFTGSRSIRILNGISHTGQIDELVSTTYDVSEAEQVILTFRYAFAQRNSGNDDRLRVYVSPNCGASWSMRKHMRANVDLVTAPMTTGSFVPAGPDQWGYAVVENIQGSLHVENFMFKLQFESRGGNHLYIDDINLNGMPVSVQEVGRHQTPATLVVPNPASGHAQLVLERAEGANVRITMMDVLGREIMALHDGQLAAGGHRVELPLGGLNSGLYFIRIMGGNAPEEVVRFVVE